MKCFGTWSVLALALAAVPAARSQQPPAPIYALPPDGTWVEYEWTRKLPGGEQAAGLLRISSVGRTRVGGVPHRWVEFCLTVKQDNAAPRFRKLLVSEPAVKAGAPFAHAVRQCFDKSAPDADVTPLSRRRQQDFLGLGLRADAVLRPREARESVTTRAGKFQARLASTEGKSGPAGREYHGWLTDEIPFGWAKLEIYDGGPANAPRLVFRAEALRVGTGARSEVVTEDPN